MTEAREPWWQRLRRTPVTAALMAICILVYAATLSAAISTSPEPLDTAFRSLWSLAGHEEVFRRFGALELVRVWVDHEWWRVFSTALLHGSLLHLVLNVGSLAAIGEHIENLWGSLRTLLLFIASSLAGCLASLVWCESSMVVGASAGILGQAGALWCARRFGDEPTQRHLEDISDFRLGVLILLCLGLGALVPGIAQAGHVGGLIMGTALGWLWSRPRRLWQTIAASLLGVGALATLVMLGRAPVWFTNYHVFRGLRALEDKDSITALEHLRTAEQRDPDNSVMLNDIAYKLSLERLELEWAEQLAHRAHAMEPENENVLDTLGWILCLQGSPETGLPLIRQSLGSFGESPPQEISDHERDCPTASATLPDVPRETLAPPQ
ncbi:MAG: rhomboid family intramembrane serine protease [Myxococcales bacterium]|nr:rhomboid family intramembrane serine protease [Myxococcales bacterium]